MAQAASFFSAGFETSSTTAAFALYELAMQPEIQNTLQKEILNALEKSNGKITYDMVGDYLSLFHFPKFFIFINYSLGYVFFNIILVIYLYDL